MAVNPDHSAGFDVKPSNWELASFHIVRPRGEIQNNGLADLHTFVLGRCRRLSRYGPDSKPDRP